MIDLEDGHIAFAVLSFGGFLGRGDKLFAVPWEALMWNPNDETFILNVEKEVLKEAPGFDKDHWPDNTHEAFFLFRVITRRTSVPEIALRMMSAS